MAMLKAFLFIAPIDEYPHQALELGLKAAGFWPGREHDAQILVTWSPWNGSYRQGLAREFAGRGRPVIIVENGWLSPIDGVKYFQVALDGWNGTGDFRPESDPRRWNRWALPLVPWRYEAPGSYHALVVGQRGSSGDARTMPPEWDVTFTPKTDRPVVRRARAATRPLMEDLRHAAECHVWTSNVASWAVLAGVPVIQHGPNLMVSELANPAGHLLTLPDRGPVLERLAWAQWTEAEIASGIPFVRLLKQCRLRA